MHTIPCQPREVIQTGTTAPRAEQLLMAPPRRGRCNPTHRPRHHDRSRCAPDKYTVVLLAERSWPAVFDTLSLLSVFDLYFRRTARSNPLVPASRGDGSSHQRGPGVATAVWDRCRLPVHGSFARHRPARKPSTRHCPRDSATSIADGDGYR